MDPSTRLRNTVAKMAIRHPFRFQSGCELLFLATSFPATGEGHITSRPPVTHPPSGTPADHRIPPLPFFRWPAPIAAKKGSPTGLPSLLDFRTSPSPPLFHRNPPIHLRRVIRPLCGKIFRQNLGQIGAEIIGVPRISGE